MTFDWTAHLREQAQWLLQMAAIPGAVDHAKVRRDEMLSDPMYGAQFREILMQAQREKRDEIPPQAPGTERG